MIILRYLTREILLTTAVISFGLFLLFFGNRFSQYLDEAVNGELDLAAIFVILAYKIPDIMVLILPVAFFLSILIAYGRFYSDNEMVVMSSGGISPTRILLNTSVSAVVVALVVGGLSLFVVPHSVEKVEQIKVQQAKRNLFDLLHPGRFEHFSEDDPRIYYFERFSSGGKVINQVLIADVNADPEREGVTGLITAKSAREMEVSTTGHRYLVLNQGHQYLGKAGELDYQVSHFDSTGNLVRQADEDVPYRNYYERQTTAFLLQHEGPKYQAELQWRVSLPILVIVLTLIAVPLSYTDPRRGRYAKIFPAFIPTIVYLSLLLIAKDYVQDQRVPPIIGMWWVHALFLAVAIALLFWNNGRPLGKWGSLTSVNTKEATDAGDNN